MFFKALRLKDFRQFEDKTVRFNSKISVILGPNAIGKSSIIEAINLLATGDSFRASRVEQMIRFRQELARVKGRVVSSGGDQEAELAGLDELKLSLILTRGQVQGKRTRRKLYSVNGNRRRKSDFVGQLLTVVFRPEDLRLIEGSPSRRRNYMNNALTLVDQSYARSLKKYKKALRRRNKLLSLIKEGEQPASVLKYWDLTLVKHGQVIQSKRRKLLNFINNQVEAPLKMEIEYEPSVMNEERLESHKKGAMGAGYTLIGPQKDDFMIQLNFAQPKESENYLDLEIYGSRGQKRLGVLWLKMAELEFLENKTSQKPVLLLDDILSELDETSRDLVLDLIGQQQTIITTVDKKIVDDIKLSLGENVSLLELG
jgi:DNA replication and repair protein RecF